MLEKQIILFNRRVLFNLRTAAVFRLKVRQKNLWLSNSSLAFVSLLLKMPPPVLLLISSSSNLAVDARQQL